MKVSRLATLPRPAKHAAIERRLAAQGKMLIDTGRIVRLRKAINDLNAALCELGD